MKNHIDHIALVSSIVTNIKTLGDLDPAFDRRTTAIRRYMGTIWDLIIPDRRKADNGWYPNLLVNAEIMVLAVEHYRDAQRFISRAERLSGEGNVFADSDALIRQLELRETAAWDAAHTAERDLSRLLHTILECGGDASKLLKEFTTA